MFEIKDSNIAGQGVFASENIKKNCVIGHAYDLAGEINNDYIAADITILGATHNHSIKPTATPKIRNRKIYFEALENIKKGSDIYLFQEKGFSVDHCSDGKDRHGGCFFIVSKGEKIIKCRYSDYGKKWT